MTVDVVRQQRPRARFQFCSKTKSTFDEDVAMDAELPRRADWKNARIGPKSFIEMAMATQCENRNAHACTIEQRWMLTVWIVVVWHVRKFRQFNGLRCFIKQQVGIETRAELYKERRCFPIGKMVFYQFDSFGQFFGNGAHRRLFLDFGDSGGKEGEEIRLDGDIRLLHHEAVGIFIDGDDLL